MVLLQQLKGATNVPFCGAKVPDRKPEHEALVETGVREEYVAGGVHGIEHARVQLIEFVQRAHE